MLAAVNLSAEFWHLARVVIALFQPLLVLALIGGLVVATAHLLTMIGTRWGDRRTSSKSMFFSVVIHLLLAMGLITLIPEYRSNLMHRLAEFESQPIRVSNSGTLDDEAHELGNGGKSTLFHAIPQASDRADLAWSRAEVPQDLSSDVKPLPKPGETLPFESPLVPDRDRLPEPVAPAPVQEMPVARPELEQAMSDLNPEKLPTESRPEVAPPTMVRDRTESLAAVSPQPDSPQRPAAPGAEMSAADYSPDRQAPDLAEISPDAELARSQNEMTTRREEPAPAVVTSPVAPIPKSDSNATSTSGGPASPLMARTESRTTIPALDTPTTERVRPRVPTEPVESFPGRMETRAPGDGSVLPLPMEQPRLTRTNDPFMRRGDQEKVPSAYRLRSDEEREKALMKFGGSQESEAAVDRSLKWMASVQNPAGYWDASEYEAGTIEKDENGVDRKNAGREADVGVTALAVLAFLGKLNTVDQGEYSPQVNRALRWIVSQQTTKNWGEGWGSTPGYLGGKATDYEAMYCHAMATFALGEAYAMSRDNPDAQWLRAPLEEAVMFILDVQNVDGGWRYIKGQREGDMSIFGWQVMALKSAEAAGISIDPQRKARMRKFLVDRQLGNAGGLAGYRSKEAASAAMTAEALYCRQMLGIADDTQANQEAIQMMLANVPRRTTLNFYYWYYGTLAMHQHGGPEWEKWNANVRDLLISEQRLTGPLAGSWDPRDIWGGYGGRMYATAIATLSLEVYYRYLPLYRIQEN
ncbi:prenyltransferase/squalene oxidase repeat-containing protein [Planctomicrobium sp. SH661]|uniref:prenyltransferase/squalene oxidase repeat-containing protein n=1 Tax=Planctomicrobium sp. SH661 TaxID=3448124 RepID=UPI003F5B09EB